MTGQDHGAKVNTESRTPDHHALAEHHAGQHREASRKLGRTITNAGELYGAPLGFVLTRQHEDLAEHAAEAIYHLRRLIAAGEERESDLRSKVIDARYDAQTFRKVADELADELERRSKRSGKPVPKIVADWRSRDEAPF